MPYGETKADCDGRKSHLPDLPTVAVQQAQQQAQTSNASGRDVRADVTSQTLSTRDHQGMATQSESRAQCSGRTRLKHSAPECLVAAYIQTLRLVSRA